MRKPANIILSLAVVALAVSCSKTDVAYDGDRSGEISISPVAGKITKAAIKDGVFPTDNHIGLFAYYTSAADAGEVTDYGKFTSLYLNDAEFAYTGNSAIWSGVKPYHWPVTGSMVFAGYSLPAPAGADGSSAKNGTVSYNLAADCLKIEGYVQSSDVTKTYDLLYFGRTQSSYDNNSSAVPVEFRHALSWIEIHAKGGEGALVKERPWSITDITLKDVATKGTFTYTGTSGGDKAVWSDRSEPKDVTAYEGSVVLTGEYQKIEHATDGTLVIPQVPDVLNVTIEYDSPAGAKITEVVPIDLSGFTVEWEAGKKYTYYLTFDPSEILVAPTVEIWPDPVIADMTF